jgi:O-antigen/teichoic acid export membrane protein
VNDARSTTRLDSTRVNASVARGSKLVGFRAIQLGLGFLSGLVIARALGPTGRAEYALPLALATAVLVVSHLSMELAISRLLSRGEATALQLARLASSASVLLGLLGSGLCLALGVALPATLVGEASTTGLALAAASVAPMLYSVLASSIMFRLGQLRAYGVIQLLTAAGQLGLLVALELSARLSPESVLGLNLLLVLLMGAGMAGCLARRLTAAVLSPTLDRGLVRRALGTGLALHPASLALYVNLRVDLFLVAAYLGTEQAGLYSLAVALAELVFVAGATLGVAALRDQAELSEAESAEYTAAFTRQSLAVSAGLAGLLAASAYPLVRFLYGDSWTGAAAPLAVLVLASIALTVEAPVRGLLLRVGRPSSISFAAVIAMLCNVVLNVALIPWLGLLGAAISSVLSYSLIAALMLLQMRKATGVPIGRAIQFPRAEDSVPRAARKLASTFPSRRTGAGS